MAWRLAEHVESGEIDNRIRDRVTGWIRLSGCANPITLALDGNPWRDLAGHRLQFRNPDPQPLPDNLRGFAEEQTGVVGDITASHKVKVPDVPLDEIDQYYKTGIPLPFHWENILYLEWHSPGNGRVVIEGVAFELEIDPEPAWKMTPEEETAQREANTAAMESFMDRMVEAVEAERERREGDDLDDEDDEPQSAAEAEADAEDARINRLLDRVTARMEREGNDPEAFDRIREEERERLRRENGEHEPDPPAFDEIPELASAPPEWDREDTDGKTTPNTPAEPEPRHPLVEACSDLAFRIHRTIETQELLPKGASEEHPLRELAFGVQIAAAKLAGALHGEPRTWPPDRLFAPHALVRFKKARRHLNDARAGLDAAAAESLADREWLQATRDELESLRETVQRMIAELRAFLRENP